MCFLTYLTGKQTKLSSQNVQYVGTRKIHRSDLIECYYEAIPIHKRPDLIDEAIRLINGEWSRSRCSRLWSLGSSRDALPTSLIVTFRSKTEKPEGPQGKQEKLASKNLMPTETKIVNDLFFNQQNIDKPVSVATGEPIEVLAHLRLLPVPSDEKSCFVESMVVADEYRGKGIGSYLIREASKYCEQVLHLKHIYLSTYDSGEFYMKSGFKITDGISIFGNGEANTVSKKVFLKKTLNYVECEDEPEHEDEVVAYNPKRDLNYQEQCKIANDVIFHGFAVRPDNDKVVAESLCHLFSTPFDTVKYYYSFDHVNRMKDKKSHHFIISFRTLEAKLQFVENGLAFGVLCYQNLFEKPVNEYDNTLLTFEDRLTKVNLIMKKELMSLQEESLISSWEFLNNTFYAEQADCRVHVYNLGILELLKMQDDLEEEVESIGWETPEEVEKELKALENFKIVLKKQSMDSGCSYRWLDSVENVNNEKEQEVKSSSDSGNESDDKEDESNDKDHQQNSEKKVTKMDKEKRRSILQQYIVPKNKESSEICAEEPVSADSKITEWLSTNDFQKQEEDSSTSSNNSDVTEESKELETPFTSIVNPLLNYFSMGFGYHP